MDCQSRPIPTKVRPVDLGSCELAEKPDMTDSWIYVVWQADYFRPMSHNSKMENRSDPHILAAERLNVGVVITFDNGESAIYSAALLYSMFPQAHRVDESKLIEQD